MEYENVSLELARQLFTDEEFVVKEAGVWCAKSRLQQEVREPEKWKREIEQVRILTRRGSAAVFLPEIEKKGETGILQADLILDGTITELKTVAGTRETLGTQFKYGYKQGAALAKTIGEQKHSVYIRLLSDLSVVSVKAKIAGELKERNDSGTFICYFETLGELHIWTYDELRAFIRDKK